VYCANAEIAARALPRTGCIPARNSMRLVALHSETGAAITYVRIT
jgi:hypothetical protein